MVGPLAFSNFVVFGPGAVTRRLLPGSRLANEEPRFTQRSKHPWPGSKATFQGPAELRAVRHQRSAPPARWRTAANGQAHELWRCERNTGQNDQPTMTCSDR